MWCMKSGSMYTHRSTGPFSFIYYLYQKTKKLPHTLRFWCEAAVTMLPIDLFWNRGKRSPIYWLRKSVLDKIVPTRHQSLPRPLKNLACRSSVWCTSLNSGEAQLIQCTLWTWSSTKEGGWHFVCQLYVNKILNRTGIKLFPMKYAPRICAFPNIPLGIQFEN
jgi:hypothetical protein